MINKHLIIMLLAVFCSFDFACGQKPESYSSGVILQQLEKLNTLGSVLYVAAHPDDENTQLIAYLANGRHFRTGYLSATRGDGGQNLVGPEIREALGVIRTQELLAARRIDGGSQFFSRANDFGYSKDPEETFNLWDKEKVLADFVWVIRNFRPDVIITRFNTEPGVTHGHHTASAILAKEAFEISGDPAAFPEQLEFVEPWKPAKIFWNTSPWFFSRTGRDFDPDNYIKVDVGQYNPFLGKSYTEISAESRSMHKSQGFGATGSRGSEYEYFEKWDGADSSGLFEGINTTWGRVAGSDQVAYHLNQAKMNFDPSEPESILPDLLSARKELIGLSDQFWREIKLGEINEVIQAVAGIYMEVTADDYAYTVGDSIALNIELINRSGAKVKLAEVRYSISNKNFSYNMELAENQGAELSSGLLIPEGLEYSHPYWLKEKGSEGMYRVNDLRLIGQPQNPDIIDATVSLAIDSQFLDYEIPVVYKRNDPVEGEVYRPVVIQPDVMVNLDDKALVFGTVEGKKVPVRVIAGTDNQQGTVYLEMPPGWRSLPSSFDFNLKNKGEETIYSFELVPPDKAAEAVITGVAEVEGVKYTKGKKVIDYPHFPTQTLFPEAKTKVVKLDLNRSGDKIGYIMGAGDEVPYSLEQIGYEVFLLEKDHVEHEFLQQFDAVILGIRAFNTVPWLSFKNQELFEYVKDGGNLIVQYNTSHRLVTEDISPLSLKLSRDRVTVEEAPVEVTKPGHPVLNVPNKIVRSDFDGWVQERGLYFPNEWSEEFTPVFSIHDPGEDPKKGSLLIAKYGKGYYCYTGLSFFRELPAGVPGAYRLLVNMISLGGEKEPK